MQPIQIAISILSLLLVSPAVRAQDTGAAPSNIALKVAQIELDKAEKEVNECEEVVERRQDQLFSASGLISVTPETVRQLADRLQAEKESMEVEEAGAKGRQEAIAKAIAQTTDRLRTRSDADEVVKQLDAVIAVRQKQLDRIRQLQATGAVPNAEVEAAEASLATARADAAAAKQKMSGGSTDLLEALNRELINLTIARQERATKLEYIEARLKQLAPALAEARNLEKALHQLVRAEHHRDVAMDQMLSVQRLAH